MFNKDTLTTMYMHMYIVYNSALLLYTIMNYAGVCTSLCLNVCERESERERERERERKREEKEREREEKE